MFDHDKVSALGLDLQHVGADLSAIFGGNFVNRFNMAGLRYKVIPQIKRVERLNPEQLRRVYVTGPNKQTHSTQHGRINRDTTVPRSLNRLQQLNAVTISGALPAPSTPRSSFWKPKPHDPAARLHDRLHRKSRQLRVGGRQVPPVFGARFVLIFLVLAAQFNSFRDPFIILLGSVPLALFGAGIFMFERCL